jgi:hypothetical protein
MRIALVILTLTVLMLSSCASKISDVQDESHIGKQVKVRGTAENTVKLGKISGFTLTDDSGHIRIGSEELPKEGSVVEVRGVLIKDSLLGYYIKADSVR